MTPQHNFSWIDEREPFYRAKYLLFIAFVLQTRPYDAHCWHTFQSASIVTDEDGFFCRRNSLLPNGCCDRISKTTSKFSCLSCQDNNCCSIYEHCVSCCQNPLKVNGTIPTKYWQVTPHYYPLIILIRGVCGEKS